MPAAGMHDSKFEQICGAILFPKITMIQFSSQETILNCNLLFQPHPIFKIPSWIGRWAAGRWVPKYMNCTLVFKISD